MAKSSIEVLTTLPSIDGWTVVPDKGKLVYWWESPTNQELRVYDLDADETETIPLEDLDVDLDTWKDVIWHDGLDRLVVSTRQTSHLLSFDGHVEPLVEIDHHFNVHGIAPDGELVLYVDYEDEWTLRLYNRETGDAWHVSDDPQQGGHAGFSPDGERIAYRRNSSNEFGEGTLVLATHEGNTIREFHVGDPTRRTQLEGWHPDGERLFVTDRSEDTYRAGLYDIDNDDVTWFGPTKYIERGVTITEDGKRVLVCRVRDDARVTLLYDLKDPDVGQEFEVPLGKTAGSSFISEHEVVLQHSTPTQPKRLLRYNLETSERETLIDTETAGINSLRLAEVECVQYHSFDGVSINALLYELEAKSSQGIVHVHGGPTTFADRSFNPEIQFLVQQGYTVLQPNYRGSTDQGRVFENALKGNLGRGEVDDVAAGARWLADNTAVDADRIGVYGHSHGGYITAMASIRYPDLWQVAIPDNGYHDAVAVFNDPNPYAQRRTLSKEEKDNPSTYFEDLSPVHRADEVGCPLCIVHGGEDDQGLSQVEAFVDSLENRGWTEEDEFRVEIFDGEGHVIGDKETLWQLLEDVLSEYL